LRIARTSIQDAVTEKGWNQEIPGEVNDTKHNGVFVTVFVEDSLRGCIGYLSAVKPLGTAINELARKAATQDGRFKPISEYDLDSLTIEITTLGEMYPIQSPSEIEIGKHGLVIEQGQHRGVLLPQVAKDRNWTVDQFLSAVCEKAYLPSDAWKEKASILKVFEAEKFSSDDSPC
jgi:uncharacterized protein